MRTARANTWNPPDTIVKANSVASFDGVLVNPEHYKSLISDHFKAKDFEMNLDKYVKGQPPPLIEVTKTNFFLTGIILGIATCLVFCH